MIDFDHHPALKGHSAAARALRHAVGEQAPRWMALLIDGPPGAGHFDVARAVHAQSKRRERPFARLDAMAHPAGRLVDLLAEAARQAADGTLFVEHADHMPPPAQLRLEGLAVEGAVGDGTHVRARVIVGARGVRLITPLREGLRERIPLPPLSARSEDLGPIAAAMLRRIGATTGHDVRLAADAIPLLAAVPDLPTLAGLLLKATPHAFEGEIPARVVRRLIG